MSMFEDVCKKVPRGSQTDIVMHRPVVWRRMRGAPDWHVEQAVQLVTEVLEHHLPWIEANQNDAQVHAYIQEWLATGLELRRIQSRRGLLRHLFNSRTEVPMWIIQEIANVDGNWKVDAPSGDQPPPDWGYRPRPSAYWAQRERDYQAAKAEARWSAVRARMKPRSKP